MRPVSFRVDSYTVAPPARSTGEAHDLAMLRAYSIERAMDYGVSLDDVRAASIGLIDLFIREVEGRCPELTLASPRNGRVRGSQVSFRHEQGYAIMQALIARGVIGDFRAPDAIRFGFTPLYLGEAEVLGAVDILEDIMTNRRWDQQKYRRKALVT